MAIALPHILFLWSLRLAGFVGPGKSRSILEFGEQNWFGDVEPREMKQFLDNLEPREPAVPELRRRLDRLLTEAPSDQRLFDLARLFYAIIFGEHAYRAVDLHGTALAEPHDLNLPLPFADRFDVVTNLGTGEHVFNQYQVFRSVHDTICGWLIAAAALAGAAFLAGETCGFEPRQEAVRTDNCQQGDPDRDAEAPRSQAVELFEQYLYGGRLHANQLDVLQEKIAAIDLICGLTTEQKQKLKLSGQGDLQRLLDQIDRQAAKFQGIDDDELPARREEIQQAAEAVRAPLSRGLFGDGSLFDKMLTRSLTDDQAALLEPFRRLPSFSRIIESRAISEGANEIVSVRFSAAPVRDEHLGSLHRFAALQSLFLDYTAVTDAGLRQVAKLPRLEQLDLSQTSIEGSGFVHLKGLKNLTRLNLNGTRCTGVGLESLAELPHLKELRLVGAPVGDAGLKSLKDLRRLEILSLRGTRITDGGLAAIGGLSELRQLYLDSTQITDAGLAHLTSLKELRMLDLRKTRVTDAGLKHLAGLENLKYLCLFETEVTAAGVAALKQSLPKLRVDR
jgi:hypothetical protein